MNTKLMVIPMIVLSASLLLTGCNAGNLNENNPSPTASDIADPVDIPQANAPKYVAPPADMEEKYKAYYFSPTTLNESSWAYYNIIGAKTVNEDSAARSTTVEEWEAARTDQNSTQAFDKMYGEVTSDVEQSALKVSEYLKSNPDVSLEEINGKKDVVVNRYSKAGTMAVEQDSKTGFYFIVFSLAEGAGEGSEGYGILVPQEGKTPDFSAK